MEPFANSNIIEINRIPDTTNPLFTIVIPTFNRIDRIFSCLNSIENMTLSFSEFEVVVVNDGGSPQDFADIQKYEWKINLTINHLKNNQGPANARNIGAQIASGKYLYFIDDDCQLDPKLLNIVKIYYQKFTDAVVGGKVENALKENIFSETSQCLVDYIYHRMNTTPKECIFFTSNNLCISKKQFLENEGFDNRFKIAAAEDREFCNRLNFKNLKLHFVKEARIYHFHEMSFKSFTKQHFNYGRGAYSFLKYKKHQGQKRILFFHPLLLLYPFTVPNYNFVKSIHIMFLFFVSQLMYVLGFSREKVLTKNS